MSQKQTPLYAVLGAGGGIGSELCRTLSREGARLVVGGRDADALQAIAADPGATAIQVDARDFEDLDRFFSQVDQLDIPLSGVVNCAGSLLLKPAHQTSQEEFESVVATNLTTAFATVRSAARRMRKAGGSIVLVSSAAARMG